MFFTKKIQVPKIFHRRSGITPDLLKNKVSEKFIELINQSLKEEFIDFYSILDVYDREVLGDKKIHKNTPTKYIDRNENYKKAKGLFAQGDSFVQQKMLEDASKQYQKGLSIYPYFFTARLNLGYVYRELGRYELSLNTYLEGIKLNGEELLLYTNIARTYTALGDTEKTIEYLWKASNLDPSDSYTLYELEKYGELIRIYKDSNDPSSLCFITKAEWESTIEHNIATAESIKAIVDMFFTIVKEERFDLLKNCWVKYSFKLKQGGIETPQWYLIKGFVERKFESDNKALETWRDGLSVFNNDIGLLMNLAKVQLVNESISTFEKIFELGDFSEETVVLYFHRYSHVNGQDKAIQRFEDFYRRYRSFEFININAFKLFEQDKNEFLNYCLRFFDDSKTLNPLYWAGRVAGLMGELNRRKELIFFYKSLLTIIARIWVSTGIGLTQLF